MKRDRKRERWMAMFESTVVSLDSSFAGRIPWDAATFHFNQGTSPGLAAVKVVRIEEARGLSFPSGAIVKPVKDGAW
jgi:hypothetical protein